MANTTLTFGVDLKDLNIAFDKINKTATSLSDVLDKNIKTATTAIKNANKELSSSLNLSDMVKTKTQINEISSKLKQMTKAKLKLDIEDAKKTLWGLKEQAISIFGAFKIFQNPVKIAIDFEKSMVNIKKLVDFDSDKEFKSFSNDIIKLTRQVPKTMTELSSITAEGAKLGIKKDELIDYTKLVAKMSNAFEMSAEETGKNIATLKNVFKIDSIKGVEELGDMINTVSDSFNTSVPQVIDLLTGVGSAGKMINLGTKEVANLGAAMTSLGLQSGEAGTTMTKVFSVLSGSGNASAEAKKAFNKLGIDIDDMKKAFEKDGQGTLIRFFDQLKGFDRFKKAEIIKALFGQEHIKNVSTLVEGMDEWKNIIKLTSNEANYLNSIQKEDERQKESLSYKLQILKQNFQELGQKVGELFLPILKTVTETISSLVNFMSQLVSTFPNLIKYLGIVAASLVGIRAITLSYSALVASSTLILGGYKNLLSLFPIECLKYRLGIVGCSGANVGFGLTLATLRLQTSLFFAVLKRGIFSLTAALFTNPFGLIAVGIGVALFLVWKFRDGFKALFSGFVSGFSTIKGAFLLAFSPFEPVLTMVKNIFGGFSVVLSPVIGWFKELFSQSELSKESLSGWQSVGEVIGKVFASIFGVIATLITAIIGVISLILGIPASFEEAINKVKAIWNSIKEIWAKIWGDDVNATATTNTNITQSTAGSLEPVIAKEKAIMQNTKQNQINDYKTLNINMNNSNATPEQVAKAVQNNSYKFEDIAWR
ncbi:phage tail tape measure protein [Campylobacter fetus]|uniref:Phage tail tape measure protein domain-containing protein n=1 Tax=Campylobacter fetus subsp. testudinum TaxID=1507806 RepID=A0AAX0HA87_CAMFE|nr:phage tail tape measure protein [Campylobacter fetus]OCR90206.1 hypothetical protein CFT12S02225_07500 [Campylobacter fetus subsp. testudinum]OCR93400.1 hypothetical protein CFT12S02842_08685 [Campylobacter fetus subsp. testudinum]